MSIEIREFGPVPEEELRELERRLGFSLPEPYRKWLAATNGGDPVKSLSLPDVDFLWEHRASGLRPDSHRDDLAFRYDHFQDRFTRDYLPVIPVSGGMIALKVRGEGTGSVWFWDDDDPRPLPPGMVVEEGEDLTPEQSVQLLIFCGADWNEFLANLDDTSPWSDEELEEILRRQGL